MSLGDTAYSLWNAGFDACGYPKSLNVIEKVAGKGADNDVPYRIPPPMHLRNFCKTCGGWGLVGVQQQDACPDCGGRGFHPDPFYPAENPTP